jgi:hypothetical protein
MSAVRGYEAGAELEILLVGANDRQRAIVAARSHRFWTETVIALPEENRRVEFVFEHREVAMVGIYRRGYFETPHAICYAPAAIGEWRYAE